MVPRTKAAPFPCLMWGVVFTACVIFFSLSFLHPTRIQVQELSAIPLRLALPG